jgi:TRAP-type C4-dicarboxylate transport system substrate-binding protein
MKKGLMMVISGLVLSLVFPAFTFTPVEAKSIVLSYSTPGPSTAYQSIVVQKALKEITERTNGQVTFKFYWAGALHAPGAVYDGVVMGGADMGFDQPSYSKGRFPVIETLEQPWGYPNAVVANQIAWDALKKFKPAELKDVRLFTVACFGHPVIISNKPVRTLSDLKPLKIRGTGNMANMIQALGAAAVSMPIFEVYDALRKGTVDGAMVGPETLSMYKFTEVVKYATEVSFIAPNMVAIGFMSLKTYNSLPPDIQNIFTDVSEKYQVIMGQEIEKYSLQAFDYAKQHQVEIIQIPAAEHPKWQAAMQTLTTKFVADMQAKGIPAQDIANFVQDAIKKAAK